MLFKLPSLWSFGASSPSKLIHCATAAVEGSEIYSQNLWLFFDSGQESEVTSQEKMIDNILDYLMPEHQKGDKIKS